MSTSIVFVGNLKYFQTKETERKNNRNLHLIKDLGSNYYYHPPTKRKSSGLLKNHKTEKFILSSKIHFRNFFVSQQTRCGCFTSMTFFTKKRKDTNQFGRVGQAWGFWALLRIPTYNFMSTWRPYNYNFIRLLRKETRLI